MALNERSAKSESGRRTTHHVWRWRHAHAHTHAHAHSRPSFQVVLLRWRSLSVWLLHVYLRKILHSASSRVNNHLGNQSIDVIHGLEHT